MEKDKNNTGERSPNNQNWMKYIDKRFDINEKIMGGIIIVFFVAFLSMLVAYFSNLSDNWRHKEDVYYQLLEKVNQNNCGFIKIN